MDQSVDSLGRANPERSSYMLTNQLSEAGYLAFLTGLIYLIAGAYQQGYQDVFGFTFISLGVEDIIAVFRKVFFPLTESIGISVIAAFLIMLIRPTSQKDRLMDVFLFLLPVSFLAVFILYFRLSGHLSGVDTLMFFIVPFYYVFDPIFWKFVFGRSQSTAFRVPLDRIFRLAQLGVASLVLVITAYNVGYIYAVSDDGQLMCPERQGRQSILVGQTKDLLICAEADVAAGKVYQHISYMKVPDNGEPLVLKVVKFVPVISTDDHP